jgi:hypothetical protein
MEITEWNELQVLLGEVRMSSEEDEISWGLSELKVFTTNSLYKFLTTGGIRSSLACKIWKCKVPLKIKVFLWQAFQDRVQTA